MQTFTAYKWNGGSFIGYSGQREYVDSKVATVRLTPTKKVKDSTGYDDGGAYVQYLRVPRGVNAQDLQQALRDTMGGSNCHHSYDCCGCSSRFVTTKMIAPRKMQVRTAVTFNY